MTEDELFKNCSIYGCVINRAAAELIERLAEENAALRTTRVVERRIKL